MKTNENINGRNIKLTKKQIKEAYEREAFLKSSDNGKFPVY
jgi:hypothetical protein